MASATTARSRFSAGGFDPFKPIFRLLTSVRFALVQLGVVIVAALLGVVFPQAPDQIRLNPPAYDAWTEIQRGKYGPLTGIFRRLDLFEVFHSLWFNALLILLLVSVAVCTVNRFTPIWRTVRRPVRRVNDRYFETAHARAAFPTPADPSAVEAVLRRKRYKVETVAERDGARYLFADRYSWAQLATFVSHLALILFMAGGVVSKVVGFQTFIAVPEGGTQPVFPVVHDNQMQVLNLDSIQGIDEQGNIVDYRTDLAVFQNGEEICRGWTTVNDPLPCNGYRFHQSTYTNNGVALQVKDRRTGQVVYTEAPVLQDAAGAPSPHLIVRDAAGQVLLDTYFTMTPISQDTLAQIFAMPDTGRAFAVSGPLDTSSGKDWQLRVVTAPGDGAQGAPINLSLRQGEQASAGGYTFEFADLRGNPFDVVQGIPGMERAALLQIAQDETGATYLDVVNMGGGSAGTSRFQLEPGQSIEAGDYEYTFVGRREYTGVLVKRDPGSWLIWVATSLLLLGTMLTFYVPRRRLWAKVTPEQTYLAGIAERSAHLGEELAKLGDEMRQTAAKARPIPS
ncbi:MAG: cytochrome c biogenesis protein ResB [Dehalococcoidia bacterium]